MVHMYQELKMQDPEVGEYLSPEYNQVGGMNALPNANPASAAVPYGPHPIGGSNR
jgi:hypothetical protein